jgi:hypothetical protein
MTFALKVDEDRPVNARAFPGYKQTAQGAPFWWGRTPNKRFSGKKAASGATQPNPKGISATLVARLEGANGRFCSTASGSKDPELSRLAAKSGGGQDLRP